MPHRPLSAAALLFLAIGGCGPRHPAGPVLRLYCGAGIRPPVAEIAKAFEAERGVRLEPDYAGSNILLTRIEQSGRGDLFMPGDAHYVEQARQRGLVESAVDACYFVPVILVRKGNPKGIARVPDLTRSGLKIGLGDEKACAIGRVSRLILEKSGIDPAAVEPNVVFRSLTVNELGLHIKAGKIDATIVWDAIARAYPEEGEIVPIPPERNVISTVPVAVLRTSEHLEIARAFQAFARSRRAREIFRRHGYTTERPR